MPKPDQDNKKRDPAVPTQAKRRTFTAAFKLKILREVDARQAEGQEIGSVLRREGLYSSAIGEWRLAREQGELEGLEPQKRGPKPGRARDREGRAEIERLLRENERLQKRLRQAELLIEVQKRCLPTVGLGREERLTAALAADAVGDLPTNAICEALAVSRATFYRRLPRDSEDGTPPEGPVDK